MHHLLHFSRYLVVFSSSPDVFIDTGPLSSLYFFMAMYVYT